MMREAIDGLISAIENGRTDIVRSIVSACERCEGEDDDIAVEKLLNSNSTVCGTVLHLATKLGDADIVRTLLSAGADPGIHNQDGQTALDLSTNSKVCDVFSQELLQSIAQSNIGRVCQLLASGVSVNLIDCPRSANTPLHWAACYGSTDTVQCLIKRKASVNAVNTDGASPLHDALNRGDMSIVEELLEAGASTSIRPHTGKYCGKTISELAEDDPDLTNLLEKHKSVPQVNGLPDDSLSKIDDSLLIQRSLSENSTASEHLTDSAHSTPKKMSQEEPRSVEITSVEVAGEKEDSETVEGRGLMLVWPQPQHLVRHEGPAFHAGPSLLVCVAPSAQPDSDRFHASLAIWRQRGDWLQQLDVVLEVEPLLEGRVPTDVPHVLSEINHRLFTRQQAYRISVTQSQASDEAGLFYATNTLSQLIRLCGEDGIPQLQIDDWPSVRDRGVLLDLSKGRILKMESLLNLVKILAYLKINQVQLYMRFKAFAGKEAKWQLPYSQSAILELDIVCRAHQVELVPVLDVVPSVGYLDLVSMRYSFLHFVQCFPSAGVVCVGPRLSSLLVDTAEEGIFTLDELGSILPVGPNQTAQLCAYIFHDLPRLLQQLPCNIMLAEYGFEATYDFEKHCKMFTDYGIPYSVIPGTAAWNSLAGCPEAAAANISAAVSCAIRHRALGIVTSHWAGVGHMTPLPISWPGFLMSAGLSWKCNISQDFMEPHLSELLNVHVFKDPAGVMGRLVVELGQAETYVLMCAMKQNDNDCSNMPSDKGSTLYQLLSQPDQVELENLSPEIFQKTMRHIRKCVNELSLAAPKCEEGAEMCEELRVTGDLMLSACSCPSVAMMTATQHLLQSSMTDESNLCSECAVAHWTCVCSCSQRVWVGRALMHSGRNPRLGLGPGFAAINMGVANLSPTQKTDLANRLLPQVETYRAAWLHRYLSHGLSESLAVLTTMLKQFIPLGHQHDGVSDGPLNAI